MKKSVILLLLIFFSFESAFACTIEIEPLRKTFRRSNAVFVGKVLTVEKYQPTKIEIEKNIPDGWRTWTEFSKVTFEAKRKWKGNTKGTKQFIGVAYYTCGCDTGLSQYEVGKDYVVYAEKEDFVTICASKITTSDWAKSDIEKLNGFGFRLWARLYPF